jgi:hypothetical protein
MKLVEEHHSFRKTSTRDVELTNSRHSSGSSIGDGFTGLEDWDRDHTFGMYN